MSIKTAKKTVAKKSTNKKSAAKKITSRPKGGLTLEVIADKKAQAVTKRKATVASKKALAAFEAEQTSKHAATVIDLGSVIIPAMSFAEANSVENIEVEAAPLAAKGTAEWAAIEARQILGETAIVWVSTQDGKGIDFSTPRYRVGLPADKDTGYLIEAGRKIIGTGSSYSEAVKDAQKRAVKAA